jgi:hypothetical protein
MHFLARLGDMFLDWLDENRLKSEVELQRRVETYYAKHPQRRP